MQSPGNLCQDLFLSDEESQGLPGGQRSNRKRSRSQMEAEDQSTTAACSCPPPSCLGSCSSLQKETGDDGWMENFFAGLPAPESASPSVGQNPAEENVALQKKLREATHKANLLKAQLDEARQNVIDAQILHEAKEKEQKARLEKEIDDLISQHNSDEKRIETLFSETETLKSKNKRLKEKLKGYSSEIAGLKEERDKAQKEFDKHKSNFDNLYDSKKSLEKLNVHLRERLHSVCKGTRAAIRFCRGPASSIEDEHIVAQGKKDELMLKNAPSNVKPILMEASGILKLCSFITNN